MGKYDPLKAFLKRQSIDSVPMTFAEIERVLGSRLPASKAHRAWWSNNPDNNVMTKGWLEAGYETESVDIAGEKLVFRRVRQTKSGMSQQGFSEATQAEFAQSIKKHPGFGFMKGLIKVQEGYDLTSPSDEVWDQGYLGEDRLNER